MTAAITEVEVVRRREGAELWHRRHAELYGELADHVHQVLLRELQHYGIVVQAVSHRVKSVQSLQDKWVRASDTDATVFKYADPAAEITDVAGVRVVTYLQHLVPKVEEAITQALSTDGPEDRAGLNDPSVPGYRGVHYLVSLPATRLALREYAQLTGLRAEVQVQTVLQHAWAEIQHDVLYKSGSEVPVDLKRRLVALAGMLELADAEFRAVAQQLALAEEVVEPVSPDEDLSPAQLRLLLHRHLGGAERLPQLWFEQSLAVLAELGITDAAAVEGVLAARSNQTAQVREFLREAGYEPGPVEVLDALLRLELGERYLTTRSAWAVLDEDARTGARERLRRLQEHVQVAAP